MAEKHKVRTTINPDVDLEVDDAELADLRAQGLLHKAINPDVDLEVDDAELADLRAQGLLHKADGKTVKSDDTKGGDAK